MLPTHVQILLASIILALIVYMPEILLLAVPVLAIFMLLNSPLQNMSMKKVPMPVQRKRPVSRKTRDD